MKTYVPLLPKKKSLQQHLYQPVGSVLHASWEQEATSAGCPTLSADRNALGRQNPTDFLRQCWWLCAGHSTVHSRYSATTDKQLTKLSSSRWEGSHLEPSCSFSFGLKNWLEKERKLTKLPNTLKIQLRVNSKAKWNLALLEILAWIKIPQKSSWLVNLIALSKHVHKAALVDTQRMFTQPYRMRLCCCRKMDGTADHHVKQEKLSSGQCCYRGK